MEIKDENALLKRAIKQVLKPLVRFLIHKQLTLPTLVELVKSAYVEVAEKEFAIEGKAPTDSRINLLTGVHRKDVKRLRDLDDTQQPSEHLSLHSLMLATWMAEPPFALNNSPQPLLATGEDSFETLSDMYTRQNIRATSILENWEELGWVTVDEENRVHLNVDALQENQLGEDQLYFFSQNLADHLATSTGNLVNKNKQLERAVFYNQLSLESIKKLQVSSKKKAMLTLKELNKEALNLQKQDKKMDDPKYRFRFGHYFYTDAENE